MKFLAFSFANARKGINPYPKIVIFLLRDAFFALRT
jgi:hypothetical protein